ncbi:MAG TPA: thioredoxin domain-containing protein [Sphingomicrobium sp.]|jgi:protein-disulfide isomerase|nr:thioredoxin domain-containing protein [Sphingomicrobium sp.]
MKSSYYLLAAAAILASGACNAEKGTGAATSNSTEATSAEPVKPPANGDWSQIVTKTDAGGFRMGNPNAKVKLVEYGSMTCPHCAAFEELGVEPLINDYVKSGKVSYEFRNYVRDPFDIAVSLIARCNGADSFFPLTRELYDDQKKWIGKLQEVPQAQLEALTDLGPDKQFLEIAKAAGLQQWAAMRGLPSSKSSQCLTDQNSVNQLVEMNSDATTQFPDFPGTPTFILNGEMVTLGPVTEAQVWPTLESKIKAALGG